MKNLLLVILSYLLIWAKAEGNILIPATVTPPPDKKTEALLKQGNRYYADGFYFEAIQYYEQALTLDPAHIDAHYQLAECYRYLLEYQKARPHYEEVLLQDEQQRYQLSGYYLALMLKLSGEYAQSVTCFDRFIQTASEKDFENKEHFLQQAYLEKEGSMFALNNIMKPRAEFFFTRLPEPVNSTYNDYAATIYQNDSSVVITSTRSDTKGSTQDKQHGDYFSDHYLFAKKEAETWVDEGVEHSFSDINTNFSEGTGVFNLEKNIFYFTGCYEDGGYCHLYQSELKDGKWQPPVPLKGNINLTGYDSKQPCLLGSGDSLIFVSNRPGGQGMQDIWLSVLSAEGNWQEPVNLGPEINTPQNELSPFYYAPEQALFFSSNGHKAYGGYDVFVSSFSANPAEPFMINIGRPFNSHKDDLYFVLGEEKGYISSNRDNADGNFDVYTFQLTLEEAVLLSLASSEKSRRGRGEVLQFFSRQDLEYYEHLPLEEQEKVRQLVNSLAFSKAIADKANLSEELSFYYESLPSEEKERIERLAEVHKNFLLDPNADVALSEDYQYYQDLPTEKKEKIKQIIEANAFQKIIQAEAAAADELKLFYEALPLEEQQKIDRAVAAKQSFLTKTYQSEASAGLDDMFFYQTLPSEQRESIARFMKTEIFLTQEVADNHIQEEFRLVYEQLPTEEKQRVDRLMQARKFSAQASAQDAGLAGGFEQNKLDIHVLALGNPKNITIEGRIVDGEQPVDAVEVSLVNGENQKEKIATTNQHGEFKFFNINYRKDQRIMFNQGKIGFIQLSSYALEELKIIVLQDTIIEETFDNIYFDTDQYFINDSSKVILDSLSAFHFRYPDVQIEITAYTDSTGGSAYNKKLSFKRASEAYTYLTDKGVNPTALHILAKGKEVPQEGKDLQYSRRLEFSIQGISASYNPTREVFVIYPQPDLSEIARKYDIPLPDLIKMNEHIQGNPAPFTPVRILANRK